MTGNDETREILDRFEVIRTLGEGGMGIVLLVHDRVLDRKVVLKQLKDTSPIAKKHLYREAQALSGIDHPNVMRVHDVIQDGDDLYVVMEYIEGETLSDRIASGRTSLLDSVDFARQIALGLSAVHANGVVHRDLKPTNIMITPEGDAKILDFGLAHFADRTTLSSEDEILGTPLYMSPEQTRGEAVDSRSDIFALGVILYEMLAGHVPYDAVSRSELMAQIKSRRPPSLRARIPSIPVELEAITRTALAKRPKDRFESAAELTRVLEGLHAELVAVLDDTTISYERKRHRTRRMPEHAGIWATLVAIGLVVVVLVLEPPWTGRGDSTLLILPFEDETRNESHTWLSNGIMDNLIGVLQGLEGVSVVSRQTVASAIEAARPAVAGFSPQQVLGIAERVDADYLVTGRVFPLEQSGGVRVECSLRAIDRQTIVDRWSFELEDVNVELLPTVERLAREIAQDLGTTLRTPEELGEPDSYHTRSVIAQGHFERGLEQYRRNEPGLATESFRQAVEADSTYVRAYWYLFQADSDEDAADWALDRAMTFRYGAPEPIRSIVRASHLTRLGLEDEAVETYEDLLGRYPTAIEARISLAYIYAERRRWADAIGEFESVRSQNPYDYSFYPNLALANIEIGRTQNAVDMILQWHHEYPEEISPLLWSIRVHLWTGDAGIALAYCDSLDALKSGAANGLRGPALRDLGRMAEAERFFLDLKADLPPRWRPNIAHVLLGHLELTRGRYDAGTAWIEEGLAIHDDAYARSVAGRLAIGRGDLIDARRHADAIAGMIGDDFADTTAVEAMGSRRWYFNLAGEIAATEGDADEAARLHRAAARFSGRWDGYTYNAALGRAYLALGDTTGAIGAFERSVSVRRTYYESLLSLATIDLARGDDSSARRRLKPLADMWRQADPDYRYRMELDELQARLEQR